MLARHPNKHITITLITQHSLKHPNTVIKTAHSPTRTATKTLISSKADQVTHGKSGTNLTKNTVLIDLQSSRETFSVVISSTATNLMTKWI